MFVKARPARLLLLVCLSVFPLLLGQVASETLEKEARSAFKAGRFKEAALKFEDAASAAAEPERRGRMELQCAWSYFNDRNQRLSREALKRGLQADPKLDIVPEFFSPEFVALARDVKKAGESPSGPAPSSAGAQADTTELKRVAKAKLHDGQFADVIYDLTSVPKERLDNEAWELLAKAYEMGGRSEMAAEARRNVRGTLAAPPVPVVPPVTLPKSSGPSAGGPSAGGDILASGRAFLERGDAFQAQAAANRAIETDPGSSDAYRLLGDAYMARGDGKLAEANWQKSIQLNPKNEGTLTSLGEYYLSEKIWDTALQQLRVLAEINPRAHGEKLLKLARDVRSAGDLERSRQIYATAAAAIPASAAILNEYAGLLIQQKDFDSAFDPMQKAVAADPTNEVLFTNLATLYRARTLYKESGEAYGRALQHNPGYIPALNGLAGLMLLSGQATEAIPLFERTLGRTPRDPDALVGLARAKRLLGDLAEAARIVESGSILDDPDLWNEAGAIAYDRGRYAEAVSFFDRAIRKRPDFPAAKSNREKAAAAAEFLKSLGS